MLLANPGGWEGARFTLPDLARPQLLERMIWNLVDNAVRHNERGGWIRLRTDTRDSAVYLEIANSGPVIPDDAVPSRPSPRTASPPAASTSQS